MVRLLAILMITVAAVLRAQSVGARHPDSLVAAWTTAIPRDVTTDTAHLELRRDGPFVSVSVKVEADEHGLHVRSRLRNTGSWWVMTGQGGRRARGDVSALRPDEPSRL